MRCTCFSMFDGSAPHRFVERCCQSFSLSPTPEIPKATLDRGGFAIFGLLLKGRADRVAASRDRQLRHPDSMNAGPPPGSGLAVSVGAEAVLQTRMIFRSPGSPAVLALSSSGRSSSCATSTGRSSILHPPVTAIEEDNLAVVPALALLGNLIHIHSPVLLARRVLVSFLSVRQPER